MTKKKVAVAMSGGVDSGVAAGILVKQGYKCVGFHMNLWNEAPLRQDSAGQAARKTSHLLGIPFYEIDFQKIFKKKVVDYFLKEYSAGLTPNPCVMCNKFIKFGKLLDYVRRLGFDYLATGHYARIVRGAEVAHRNFDSASDSLAKNRTLLSESLRRSQGEASQNLWAPRAPLYRLLMGVDKLKDQSYFLYNLTQEQLGRIIFPVGNYTKKQVKATAEKWKLPVARRPESQEICFLPESDYRPFLKRQIPKKIIPGEVVDTNGRVIGRHYGLPLYTIGQRHGFILNSKFNPSIKLRVDGERSRTVKILNSKSIPPFYVIGKDGKKNRLIVGFGKEAERKEFWVKEVNWINQLTAKRLPLDAKVRIRHQGELLAAGVQRLASRVKVILKEPERGVAPGQAVVFYKGEEVLGGGIILDIDQGT